MKSVKDIIEQSIGIPVYDSAKNSVYDSSMGSVYGSVYSSVWIYVWDYVWDWTTVNQYQVKDGINEAY
jgi:hypothetical protein